MRYWACCNSHQCRVDNGEGKESTNIGLLTPGDSLSGCHTLCLHGHHSPFTQRTLTGIFIGTTIDQSHMINGKH